MRFVLAMTVRELRASWRRLFFFFICLSIGVGAIVAIRSVIQSVRQVFAGEARALITADAVITSNRAFDEKVGAAIDERLRTAGASSLMSVEVATMVRGADTASLTTRMVELRAVERGFPVLRRDEARRRAALRLLAARELRRAGSTGASRTAQARGGRRDSHRHRAVHNPRRHRSGTGTPARRVQHGPARVHQLRRSRQDGPAVVREPRVVPTAGEIPDAGLDALVAGLRQDFTNTFARVRSYKATEDDIGEDFTRAENYLSLVGLVIVILGGIGVSSVTRVFVAQKIKQHRDPEVSGWPVVPAADDLHGPGDRARPGGQRVRRPAGGARDRVDSSRPWPPRRRRAWSSTTGLTALSGRCRDSASACSWRCCSRSCRCSRSATSSRRCCCEPRRGHAAVSTSLQAAGHRAIVVAGLVGLTIWQAGSRVVGTVVAVGFAGTALVLHLAGIALICRHSAAGPGAMVRAASRGPAIEPAGQSGAHRAARRRPGQLLHRRRALAAGEPRARVQRQPVARSAGHVPARRAAGPGGGSMTALLERWQQPGTPQPTLLPVLRARVTGVQGREVSLDNYEDVRGRGSLAREYTITYRPALERNEAIVDGTFWDATPSADGRGLDRREPARAVPHQRRRHRALRRAGPRDRGARRPASGTSTGPTAAPAGSCSSSGPARSTPRRTASSRSSADRTRSPRARKLQGEIGRALSERVGHRRPRDADDDPHGHRERDARRHRRRQPGRPERAADPDRRRRDDQVPAHLRGRDLQDAGRDPPHDCQRAAPRIRRARGARRERLDRSARLR